MIINFYNGHSTKKDLLGSYYLHPTLKLQPYNTGFELVLWFYKYYVSCRIIFNT